MFHSFKQIKASWHVPRGKKKGKKTNLFMPLTGFVVPSQEHTTQSKGKYMHFHNLIQLTGLGVARILCWWKHDVWRRDLTLRTFFFFNSNIRPSPSKCDLEDNVSFWFGVCKCLFFFFIIDLDQGILTSDWYWTHPEFQFLFFPLISFKISFKTLTYLLISSQVNEFVSLPLEVFPLRSNVVDLPRYVRTHSLGATL